MEHGYDLDPSVLDDGITVLCGVDSIPALQIHIRNERQLFVLIEALLELYRERMESK